MMRIARWKVYVICFALGFALLANVAQALLAAQTRARLERDVGAHLALAYASALNDARQVLAQPTPEEKAVRLAALRARLDGSLTSLSGLGDYVYAATGAERDALFAPIEEALAAAASAQDERAAASLEALRAELLERIAALPIEQGEKDAILNAYR